MGLYKCGEFNDLHDGFDIFPQFPAGLFLSHYATLNLFYTFSRLFVSLLTYFSSSYFFCVPAPGCVLVYEVLEQYKNANDLSPIQWNWNG